MKARQPNGDVIDLDELASTDQRSNQGAEGAGPAGRQAATTPTLMSISPPN